MFNEVEHASNSRLAETCFLARRAPPRHSVGVLKEFEPNAAPENCISIHGAREHNLKNLSLTIPRDRLVVVTGVSGSGKSTLAFDLIFAEGQRRFLDSMNVYARQFVEQLAPPDVDLITGIPPTVSIEQRNSRGGGKSTVATVTEIYHFLRLLFARLGTQYCPDCDRPVEAQTRDQVGHRLREEVKRRGHLLLLAPVVKNRKGFHTEVGEWAAKHGYAEVRADGKIHSTAERLRLDRFREHDVEIVVGVLESRSRNNKAKPPQQLIDEALKLGGGTLLALDDHKGTTVHSTERACPQCGQSFQPLDPKMFSYNSPQGWCERCRGFGELFYLPDVERGARAEAIEESWFEWQEGKREICPECDGSRLKRTARYVRIPLGEEAGKGRARGGIFFRRPSIVDFSNASVEQMLGLCRSLRFSGRAREIARDILPEIRERLKFLAEVGLGYLQLGRSATTLSGGEAQRIRLAAQMGSNLSGVLYVLDEPTIGLHARDNQQLLAALDVLKKRGNSLLVVEHDEETMRRADYVIDLGPGAGIHGGQVVACGTLEELQQHADSVTGACLREAKQFPARGVRREMASCPVLALSGAQMHNLKNLTVEFPLQRLVVVSGVSGSGKSTLVRECLLPALRSALDKKRTARGSGKPDPRSGNIFGQEHIQAVYEVDQSPIGRTPRSTPATYVGFFDAVRQLFAQVPEARLRGFSSSRFSFNSPQGRCPECAGAGTIKLEMSFLPPAYMTCETCGGTRYNPETLDIRFKDKTIADVLGLTVAEAIDFFAAHAPVRRPLEALRDTGLDYVKLGQTSPTLSGGEAQRLKLVAHLLSGFRARPVEKTPAAVPDRFQRSTPSLFILEEPTIGLHMADVRRLVRVLQRLVDAGHSVIVIEHNLDLIAEADWIIDLGPEAGEGGGEVVAEGTPEQVARNRRSHTGRFLAGMLNLRRG
jgi:excinuclease ABC subunit A